MMRSARFFNILGQLQGGRRGDPVGRSPSQATSVHRHAPLWMAYPKPDQRHDMLAVQCIILGMLCLAQSHRLPELVADHQSLAVGLDQMEL